MRRFVDTIGAIIFGLWLAHAFFDSLYAVWATP